MSDIADYDNVIWDDDNYNCLHFAVAGLREITGQDYTVFVGSAMTGRNQRKIDPKQFKKLTQSAIPVNNSLAVMHGKPTHVGVYHNGHVIHLTESGVQCQPPHIVEINHGNITYYVI